MRKTRKTREKTRKTRKTRKTKKGQKTRRGGMQSLRQNAQHSLSRGLTRLSAKSSTKMSDLPSVSHFRYVAPKSIGIPLEKDPLNTYWGLTTAVGSLGKSAVFKKNPFLGHYWNHKWSFASSVWDMTGFSSKNVPSYYSEDLPHGLLGLMKPFFLEVLHEFRETSLERNEATMEKLIVSAFPSFAQHDKLRKCFARVSARFMRRVASKLTDEDIENLSGERVQAAYAEAIKETKGNSFEILKDCVRFISKIINLVQSSMLSKLSFLRSKDLPQILQPSEDKAIASVTVNIKPSQKIPVTDFVCHWDRAANSLLKYYDKAASKDKTLPLDLDFMANVLNLNIMDLVGIFYCQLQTLKDICDSKVDKHGYIITAFLPGYDISDIAIRIISKEVKDLAGQAIRQRINVDLEENVITSTLEYDPDAIGELFRPSV